MEIEKNRRWWNEGGDELVSWMKEKRNGKRRGKMGMGMKNEKRNEKKKGE